MTIKYAKVIIPSMTFPDTLIEAPISRSCCLNEAYCIAATDQRLTNSIVAEQYKKVIRRYIRVVSLSPEK